MNPERAVKKPPIEVLKENSVIESIFKDDANWLVFEDTRFIERKTLSRVFTQCVRIGHSLSHINASSFLLLECFSQERKIEIENTPLGSSLGRGIYLDEKTAGDFLVFADKFLPNHPKFNLKIKRVEDQVKKRPPHWLNAKPKTTDFSDRQLASRKKVIPKQAGISSEKEEKIRLQREMPKWSAYFVKETMSCPFGRRIKGTLLESKTSEGFSMVKKEVDRSYWNLGRFLQLNRTERSQFWVSAGTEEKGYYSYTPLTNLTRLLIWQDTKQILTEKEQAEFIDGVLMPLWKNVFGIKPLSIEIGKKNGPYLTRVCFVQAVYLLSKALDIREFYFGVRLGRKNTQFAKP